MRAKLYLSKFKTGNETHLGLSVEDTRIGTKPDTFHFPFSPCCHTVRSHSYPVSKRTYSKEELLKFVTCDVCKERIKNLGFEIIIGL
jgi:hypothetical protein